MQPNQTLGGVRWVGLGLGFGWGWGLTVVNEGGGAEPQLGTSLAGGVHDAEIVDAGPEHGAVGRAQLRDASQEDLHPLPREPADRQTDKQVVLLLNIHHHHHHHHCFPPPCNRSGIVQ